MKTSRGLRNNNPLNIRRNKTHWKGLAEAQGDSDFFTFRAPEWGYRAAFITLRNYKLIHGLDSIEKWISRWAPPMENDTQAYISCVCKQSGFTPSFTPDIYDKKMMCSIVSAMSFMENGIPALDKDVEKGWWLAG